jgi:hypothetical protein
VKRDAAIKVGSMIYNALVILTGRGPMSADDFGGDLWSGKKRGRTTSSGGGGDYGAQMFLGRLRKLGFARTTHDPGSSRWEATPAGRIALAIALTASGAPGEVRQLLRTSRGGGRAVGPRELTADLERGRRGQRIGWRVARNGDRDDGAGR